MHARPCQQYPGGHGIAPTRSTPDASDSTVVKLIAWVSQTSGCSDHARASAHQIPVGSICMLFFILAAYTIVNPGAEEDHDVIVWHF